MNYSNIIPHSSLFVYCLSYCNHKLRFNPFKVYVFVCMLFLYCLVFLLYLLMP